LLAGLEAPATAENNDKNLGTNLNKEVMRYVSFERSICFCSGIVRTLQPVNYGIQGLRAVDDCCISAELLKLTICESPSSLRIRISNLTEEKFCVNMNFPPDMDIGSMLKIDSSIFLIMT
jgi:hypothetical protein